MKQYLSIALALVSVVLAISFIVVKRSDNARHVSDAGTIVDFSNRLDSVQAQITVCNGTIHTLSSSLDECRSESLTFSNHLIAAEATVALDAKQIADLNRQVAEVTAEKQNLAQRVMDLTNQMASLKTDLTQQLTTTQGSLDQANKNYALLENRFRIDVAERVVVERKFNNPAELQAQMKKLKQHPAEVISAESIYAGLDVEVKSNQCHVITQN